jgi:hypothetical protein
MTTRADDSTFPEETAGATSSQHLTNRKQDPGARVGHLRIVPIENPRADDDAPAPVRSNRVVLAFARLVREALEAEDEASDKGA